jgi:NAD(P)-dependent dehydrogenase (short-subunit alcohol dehydrogenase family)
VDKRTNLFLARYVSGLENSFLITAGQSFTVQKALPLFRDGSSIILTASIAGSKGYEGSTVYSSIKAAIRSFVRSWTVDLKRRKIRVNAISPGPIDTPMTSGMVQSEGCEQLKSSLAEIWKLSS